jgi:hypothetical protein
MKHRKLRIAWSVAWGLLAVLLCVVWVRSSARLEILEKRIGARAVQASSVKGRVAIGYLRPHYYTIGKPYLNVGAGDAADWRKGSDSGFAYYGDGLMTAVVAPHWVPTLFSVAFATIPWTVRRWRFGLRTLMIATTLVAGGLGLAVWLSR